MVGVAGKSKGCKTCRQRKIACGLQRPQCAQCIKSSRICLGYDRNLVFVPVQAKVEEEKTVVRSLFGDANRTTPTAFEQLPTTFKPEKDSGSKARGSSASAIAETPMFGFHYLIPNQLHVPAGRQQLFDTFISTCVPQTLEKHGSYGKLQGGAWVLQLPKLLIRTPALEASILSISASVLGRIHNNEAIVRESLKLYTTGLGELQKALWNPKLMYDDETLAACLCLSLYEAIECPGDGYQAYYNHCKGCMKLVEARGVDRHLSGVAHELFLGLRAQGILVCMANNRTSFLSTPLWMDGPFKVQGKGPLDRLVDCLCQAPAIYEAAETVSRLGPTRKLEFHIDSIAKCWEMDSTLQEVYNSLKEDFPSPMFWSVLATEPNPADDPVRGKVFPVSYQFPDLTVARSLMFYWSCRLMVWTGFFYLYRGILNIEIEEAEARCQNYPKCAILSETTCHCRHLVAKSPGRYQYDQARLRPLDFRTDLKSLTDNVCQSVEYCMKTGIGVFGLWSVSTPLTIVYETAKNFPNFDREIAWMEATLRELQRNGLRIIQYSTTIDQPAFDANEREF